MRIGPCASTCSISLATLAAASVVRLQLIPETRVAEFVPEIIAMAAAGVVAAWIGAGVMSRIPKEKCCRW